MSVSAVVVHRIPGRVRLRIDAKRGDAGYFANLSEHLGRLDNVVSVKANPVTGSVALEFAGGLEELLQQAQENELLTVDAPGSGNGRAPLPAGWPAPEALAFDVHGKDPINLVSGREINRDFMLGSMWLLLGLIQMLRKQWFPPSLTALWYARQAFDLSNERR